jgi:trk system potassium uptake protein TrkH
MALGGMGSSTAGGVKALRVGLTVRTFWNTIKEALLPEGAIISDRYWQNGPKVIRGPLAQSVMAISLLYVGLYLLGTAVGIAYGIPLQQALFESISAAANVGLSVGVTDPSMPIVLEIIYILQMWAGRLEFVAVFALIGFLVASVRGR